MQIRTDLALEQHEMHSGSEEGIVLDERQSGRAKITKITIVNDQGATNMGKPIGEYITIEVPPFSDNVQDEELLQTVAGELKNFLPQGGTVLVAGLGNTVITPDALGPKTASRVLATRHIGAELARSAGLDNLRSVAVISPGVLGQTGIETYDIIAGAAERVKPSALVVIDALASRRLSRLGCTVQMANTGIEPGAGVGNARREISRSTLGIPVISMGVPTVVDAGTLVSDLTDGKVDDEQAEPGGCKMIVTPREIDLLIERASKLLGDALNIALQPSVDRETLYSMLS